MAVESVSGCSWNECPDQRGISVRMLVEWVSGCSWNPQRERNLLFDQETGYIFSVEQGEDRGYHIHAAFFFNGAEVSADIYRAQRIGELWQRITRGQGYFNNCNLDKEKYQDKLGIGLIHRKDLAARDNVHYAMCYLVKNEQQMLIKPVGARCLRKGQAKKVSGAPNRFIAQRA